jgi:prevent-host-death family protein
MLDVTSYILYTLYMNSTYTVTEAREKFAEILGRVRYGDERIELTHHGVVVAHVSPGPADNKEHAAMFQWAQTIALENEELKTPKAGDLSEETMARLAKEFITMKAATAHVPLPYQDFPDKHIVLLLGDQASGKTWGGAHWIARQAMETPGWWGVCAPTFADVKNICFEGPCGVRRHLRDLGGAFHYDRNKNDLRVTLTNGGVIQGYSMEEPDAIRGANLHGMWIDDFAPTESQNSFWIAAEPTVTVGMAGIVITTTPKQEDSLWSLIVREDVHVISAASSDNPYVTAIMAMKRR